MTQIALMAGSAERVRLIVSETCGSGYWLGFQAYAVEPQQWHEWRFQGKLGFGGKLHINAHRGVYVTAYPEDLTPERQAMIDKANDKLASIALVWNVGREGELC